VDYDRKVRKGDETTTSGGNLAEQNIRTNDGSFVVSTVVVVMI
jgi:hypothetical protein